MKPGLSASPSIAGARASPAWERDACQMSKRVGRGKRQSGIHYNTLWYIVIHYTLCIYPIYIYIYVYIYIYIIYIYIHIQCIVMLLLQCYTWLQLQCTFEDPRNLRHRWLFLCSAMQWLSSWARWVWCRSLHAILWGSCAHFSDQSQVTETPTISKPTDPLEDVCIPMENHNF